MSHRITRKRLRDQETVGRWRSYPDEAFTRAGIPRQAFEGALSGFLGDILVWGSPGYDALLPTLLSDAAFSPQPKGIFQCACENDVDIALAIMTAAPQPMSFPFTVRSGGHCTAGFSANSNSFLIDVSGLDFVLVENPLTDNPTATIGTGCNFATLDRALDNYGLHVPGGECDEVCVGGYMQGGGQGFTSRTFGMHCDNVIEVRVMLWDGSIVTANSSQNADLWWAIRGGTGGNFGILLTEKVQLRPLGEVYGWAVRWPLAQESDRYNAAVALLMLQNEYMLTAPPELNPQVMICYQGDNISDAQPYLMIRGLDTRGQAVGQAVYQAFGALTGAEMQYDVTDRFINVNKQLLEYPYDIPQLPTGPVPPEDKQARYVSRTLNLADWMGLLDLYVTTPNPYSYICLELYGGAMNSYPIDQSAFIHRTSAFSAFLDVFWGPGVGDQAEAETFLTTWCTFMDNSLSNGEIYQNYPSMAVPDYRKNYWQNSQNTEQDALGGLIAVKAKYDAPSPYFQFPQMVSPYPGQPAPPVWPEWLNAELAKPIVRDTPPRISR